MQLLTKEESQLVHDYIFTEWARKVLEKDLNKVNTFKFPDVYRELIESALHRLSLDMRDIKRKMFDQGIKVYDTEVEQIETGKVFRYEVKCRGIHEEMSYMDHMVRNHTEEYVRKYLKPTSGEMG